MDRSNNKIIVRSSAAEYLTFITATGESGVEAIYADENVWLSQKMMALLYDVEINTINYHIKKLTADMEIENSTIRNFRIVQTEGSRSVERDVTHYNLKAIIAVGYKVDSEKAVQFRKWATDIIESFTIKGFALDDERLKEYNNCPKEDYSDADLIIDFYQRFLYRMEYMMKVGKENGYNLISFMGP